MNPNIWAGSAVVGINSDSNANSVADSGAVDVFGVSVPLDQSSGRAADEQMFSAVNATYTRILPGTKRHSITAAATGYKTWQASLHNLDLTVKSIKVGPTFNLPEYKANWGFDVTYSDINLGGYDYLNNTSFTVRGEKALGPRASLTASFTRERRRFKNSPASSTYEDRNGRAHEGKIGITAAFSPKDMLTATLNIRRESTKTRYNDNRQAGITLGYTHLFEKGWFINVLLNRKRTRYGGADPLVNSDVIRHDNERSMTITLGKRINDKLTATCGYQYKNINSNLQNYEYENERVSASMSYSF